MADFLLGTSGYDYPEWRGSFYPEGLKRADFLSYYATVFNALELNFSFYGMPTARQMTSFYERSDGRLRFSVKANRLLTHETGWSWKDAAREFSGAVEPLLERDALCAVLFQFPQGFRYTRENRLYLAALLDEFRRFPRVVEFRQREWVRESVFAGLEERGAGIVFCDMPMCHLAQMPAASFDASGEEQGMLKQGSLPAGNEATSFVGETAYIRLHGRNAGAWYAHELTARNGSARYRYDYSDEELSEFVPVIRHALGAGKQTAVFFNNHPNGSGAKNAVRLGELVRGGET